MTRDECLDNTAAALVAIAERLESEALTQRATTTKKAPGCHRGPRTRN